jgi:imidazolonepropionase-like amidohydrolase
MPSFDGPLIRAAGPMLTAPGGYPTSAGWGPAGTGHEVSSPEEAAAAVEELVRLGAAAIKVSLNAEAGPTLADAELAAICDAAHAADLPVTAHAQGAGQVERALGAGVDELAHTPWMPLSDAVIQTAAAHLRIVTTLDILGSGRDTPEIRVALDNLRRFHVAGGSVVYGTDLGNGDVPAGIHEREARLMAEAGIEPEEVLEALIRAPLEPDAPADLVELASSPLEDLSALGEVRTVIRAGRVVGG